MVATMIEYFIQEEVLHEHQLLFLTHYHPLLDLKHQTEMLIYEILIEMGQLMFQLNMKEKNMV
jgi:hypothetical protein